MASVETEPISPALVPAPTGPLVVEDLPAGAATGVRLSLVIPTYNEGKNLPEMVQRLTTILESALGGAYELIVVDDDSKDRTWEVALELSLQYQKLRVMRRVNERGLSSAVIRGWQVARGDVLGVIDADLQHPPEVTAKLHEEMTRGADLAVGSRNVEGGGVSNWAIHRRALSRGAQLLGLIILPGVVGRVSDPMSGYFMFSRSAIAGVALNPLGYKILIEVIGRGRIGKVAEVGYVFRERTAGESKVTSQVYIEYLRHLVRLRIDSLPVARFLRFALVGLSGVFVDMAVLYFLSDPSTFGWGLTRSKVIAASTAVLNNFVWNDFWAFGDIAARQPGMRHRFRRLLGFAAICGLGIGLNVVLLNLMFNLLQMNRYVANLIAIAIVTGWNFFLNSKLNWRDDRPR
jgi:dolichol-phosphate mannosyltransferase